MMFVCVVEREERLGMMARKRSREGGTRQGQLNAKSEFGLP